MHYFNSQPCDLNLNTLLTVPLLQINHLHQHFIVFYYFSFANTESRTQNLRFCSGVEVSNFALYFLEIFHYF